MAGLDVIHEAVLSQSLQDARALSVRAQETAATMHQLTLSNAIALQHQAALRYMQSGFDASGVEQAYRGSHLKKGSEVDSQESVAEGVVYKGEAAASFPQTQELTGSSLVSLEKKLDNLVASLQQVVKLAQSTPPETGGKQA